MRKFTFLPEYCVSILGKWMQNSYFATVSNPLDLSNLFKLRIRKLYICLIVAPEKQEPSHKERVLRPWGETHGGVDS